MITSKSSNLILRVQTKNFAHLKDLVTENFPKKSESALKFDFVTSVQLTEDKDTERQKVKLLKMKKGVSSLVFPHQSSNERWEKKTFKSRYGIHPKDHKYFDYLPLKPGIDFFRKLATTHYDIEKLKINLPDTLCYFNNIYTLLYSEKGFLKKTTDVDKKSFYYSIIESGKYLPGQTDYAKALKFACLLKTDTFNPKLGMNSDILNFKVLKDKTFFGFDPNSILQKYVEPHLKKVILYRLVYYTSQSEGIVISIGIIYSYYC